MSVNEVEFLKQQLIAKDEMICFLKTQLLALQNKPTISIIEQPKQKKFDVESYLNITCKNAINFIDLFGSDYLLNDKKNKWIQYVGTHTKPVLKYIEYGYYPKITEFATDMFLKVFNSLEQCDKPIFCNNKKNNLFFYKQDNKWETINGNDLMKIIYNKMTTFLSKILYETSILGEKLFEKTYKKTQNDYVHLYRPQISLIFYSLDKEPFTNYCLNKMKPLCSVNKNNYSEADPHDWSEFKEESAKESDNSDEE